MSQKISHFIKYKNAIIVTLAAILVLAAGAYLIFRGGKTDKKFAETVESNTPASEVGPAKPGEAAENIIPAPVVAPEAIAEIAGYKYTETYVNPANGFSFKYPQDFTISDLPSQGSEVILAQNAAKNIGLQIVISPFDGADVDITAEYIKSAIPDMKIGEPNEVQIGANRQGLAFKSDNEAFGGASREIWFVSSGKFYQLTTYDKSGEFLDGLFRTWKFE